MDYTDIEIEAMVGLYKAIKHYRKDKQCLFSTFAKMCVKGQVLTLLSKAQKEKNIQFVPLDKCNLITSDNIEDALLSKDMVEIILAELSKLEGKILFLYLKGFSYNEIAKKLNITNKSVTNALYRIRAKAKNSRKTLFT